MTARMAHRFWRGATDQWPIWTIGVVCVLIELVLFMSDQGFLDGTTLRRTAYDYGGFWPGLLTTWRPNYALQPYLMFLTYGFLHGGLVHVGVNMITLWSLGSRAIDRVGPLGFLVLYFGSLLGGGVGFGLLAPSLTPMVGASGALFGVVGGLLAWTYVDRYALREGLWPIGRAMLYLVALNVVLWWTMDGQLAWQTHLGGFVFGWVLALLIDPTARTD